MRRLVRELALMTMLLPLSSGCANAPPPAAGPSDPAPRAAPWERPHLAAASVPQAYLTAWSRAENRARCALIAFSEPAGAEGASTRTATFSGGWGVAYDLPDQRSAFGVAGTGVEAAEPSYGDWPHGRTWADGSTAGYGPEGGTGPNQLAYLRVTGQDCLYNVWSRLGRSHLEMLLESLRFVDTPGG